MQFVSTLAKLSLFLFIFSFPFLSIFFLFYVFLYVCFDTTTIIVYMGILGLVVA